MSRAAALFVAGALVLAHLAALRHETSVAHVRDALTGLVSHAHALSEHHEATAASDMHGRDADHGADLEDCAIIAGLERAPVSQTPIARVATAPPPPTPLLLLAPKTSPPTFA